MAKKGKYSPIIELNPIESIVNKRRQQSPIKESKAINSSNQSYNVNNISIKNFQNKSNLLLKQKSKSEPDMKLEEDNDNLWTISNLTNSELDIQLEIDEESESKESIASEHHLDQNLLSDYEIYKTIFKENNKKTELLQPKSMTKRSSDKYLNDVCCLALLCAHQYLALIHSGNKILYLPHMSCSLDNYSIKQIVEELQKKLFKNIRLSNLKIITERIQIQSKMKKFIHRFTFIYNVEQINKRNISTIKCICQTRALVPLNWCSYSKICQMLSTVSLPMEHGHYTLFGPEPKFIFDIYSRNNLGYSTWTEVIPFEDCEDKDNVFYIWAANQQRLRRADELKAIPQISDEEKSKLCCLHLEKSEICSLYNEFTLQCFPSIFMTFYSFKCLMDKLISNQPSSSLPLNEQRQYQYFK